nr:DUF6427 family protein [Allomuricauda sp.]
MNYVVLVVFLLLYYAFYLSYQLSIQIWKENLALHILAMGALFLELLVINEIIRKEKVTGFSSFSMLFFALLLLVFPDTLLDQNGIFANFFLLVAIWRLLAVKSMKNVKHKIFDASFFICVSSLFYDWTLVFLLLVFLVINVYERNNFKNWIVPLVAIMVVGVLSFTVLQLSGDLSFFERHYTFEVEFLKEGFPQAKSAKLVAFSFLFLILMTLVFLKLRKKGGGKLLALRILFFAFLVSVVLAFLKLKSSAPIILGFFPAAVFLTNYIETIRNVRYKEIALSLLILIPVLIFFTEITF